MLFARHGDAQVLDGSYLILLLSGGTVNFEPGCVNFTARARHGPRIRCNSRHPFWEVPRRVV